MSSVTQQASRLINPAGMAATLQAVHIEGQVTGLMLTMTSRQHFVNTGPENLEAIYTFPLPWGATLLGLNAEIGCHKLQGTVMEKRQATNHYEQALENGDTPIMVERSRSGLYTANLGNLQAGEKAVIEIEYAQLLRFEQGQIRITVPTTVAPRFGDAHHEGGLDSHESVQDSMLVEYPLTVQITLTSEMAQAGIESPTHTVTLNRQDDALVASLTQGGFLDRDFVLLLQGLQGQSFATFAPDGDGFAMLASFCPNGIDQPREPLLLKILVDCSGSMAGDSIEAAREALHEVLKELDEQDWISYSRFGSQVVHGMPGLVPCNAVNSRMVADLICQTEADLGGTEMNDALLSTFNEGTGPLWQQLKGSKVTLAPRQDVLLITDGDIWDIQSVAQSARVSGHRVFAIGVGCAPVESLLREVAEKSGGACELVSSNQSPVEAIVRMFHRLRSPIYSEIGINWGQPVQWLSAMPSGLYAGDTIHLCARLASQPEAVPVLSWMLQGTHGQAAAAQMQRSESPLLSRLVAARQTTELQQSGTDEAQTLELALRYQLVTDQTNLILVHLREDGQKAQGLPVVKNITHMRAAGWGGLGRVRPAPGIRMVYASRVGVSYDGFDDAFPQSLKATQPALQVKSMATAEPTKPPTALIEVELHRPENGLPWNPLFILQQFDRDVVAGRLQDAAFVTKYLAKFPVEVLNLINGMGVQISSRKQAMALLIYWAAEVHREQFSLSGHAKRILRHSLGQLDPATLASLSGQLTEASVDSLQIGVAV